MYLCLCKGLTERDVDQRVRAGHCSNESLIAALGLDDGGVCGRCPRAIRRCGFDAWRTGASETVADTVPGLSLVDQALTAARPRAAEPPPGCGLPACGAALCAACAARSMPAGLPASIRQ